MGVNVRGHSQVRTLMILALASWTISAAQVVEALLYPEFLKGNHLILGAIALFGLVGCLAWVANHRFWRRIVVTAAIIYLAFFAFRTFVFLIYPWLGQTTLLEAVWLSFRVVGTLVTHHLSEGRILQGLSELFFEWLMPLSQIVVLAGLVWPLTTGSRGDAPRAARA